MKKIKIDGTTIHEAVKKNIPFKGRLAILKKTIKTNYVPGGFDDNGKFAAKGISYRDRQEVIVPIGSVVMVMNHNPKLRGNFKTGGGDTKILWNEKLVYVLGNTLSLLQIEDVFEGCSFCITGHLSKPREYFKSFIQMKGGEYKNSLSKKVDYLIVGEQITISGISSKQKKAENWGIPVITENQFHKMFSEKDNNGQRPGANL